MDARNTRLSTVLVNLYVAAADPDFEDQAWPLIESIIARFVVLVLQCAAYMARRDHYMDEQIMLCGICQV